VLNTEAHPFPRFDASKKRFKTGWARIPRDAKGELVLKTEKEKVKEGNKAATAKESVESSTSRN
jgi:mannosyl-oligosaccharide alpha-1,2-mannosidase